MKRPTKPTRTDPRFCYFGYWVNSVLNRTTMQVSGWILVSLLAKPKRYKKKKKKTKFSHNGLIFKWANYIILKANILI